MSFPKEKAVLILAAGSIKNKYQSYTFLFNSPGLLPIASRSVLSIVLDFYQGGDYACYVCVNEEDVSVLKKELAYYAKVHFVPVQNSEGVVDSLQQSLHAIQEDDITVNLVTTVPTEFVPYNSLLLAKQADNVDYYSGIEFTSTEEEHLYRFKGAKGHHPFFPFTGIFRTSKEKLLAALPQCRQKNDLLRLAQVLPGLEMKKVEWIDVGHEINYSSARRQMISSRSFNSISVSNFSGILTKRSAHKQKLYNETKYISMLPTELQVFYPRVFGLEDGTVHMEYYGYPNLSEYQLYRFIPDVQWTRIFDSLQHVLELMQTFKFSVGKEAFCEFYYTKTVRRIDDFEKQLNDPAFFSEAVAINGDECKSFASLKEAVRKKIEGMYNERQCSVMHGDFCFNNILFDTFSNTVKLIDPRGSFGENCTGIYGDPNYDLAKLLHSTVGHYDYIVNNLFQFTKLGENVYEYSFPLRSNAEILDELSEKLIVEMGADRNRVYFIVGLLFLSMCPLHSDNVNRQRLMYLHGLRFINQNI